MTSVLIYKPMETTGETYLCNKCGNIWNYEDDLCPNCASGDYDVINRVIHPIQSQNLRIRKYLESGKSIMDFDAIYMFGCRRLPARIYDLKKIGVNIAPTEMVKVTSDGRTKHVAKYKLVK
jgi:hypothetical protein